MGKCIVHYERNQSHRICRSFSMYVWCQPHSSRSLYLWLFSVFCLFVLSCQTTTKIWLGTIRRAIYGTPSSSKLVRLVLIRLSRAAKYCDERVCTSVCTSVHWHVSRATCPNLTKFSVHVTCEAVTVARSSSNDSAIAMYFRFCGWRHVSP